MTFALALSGCSSDQTSYETGTAPQVAALQVPAAVGRQARAVKPAPVDRIVVVKSQRRMALLRGDELVAEYNIALGRNPVGDKQRQGDGRTPEGVYRIDLRNANSAFHRALRISYPDRADRAQAVALGVAPGGSIMIHGLPNGKGWIGRSHLEEDWTDGCIAVTNQEMDEIWRAVGVGTVIEIRA